MALVLNPYNLYTYLLHILRHYMVLQPLAERRRLRLRLLLLL